MKWPKFEFPALFSAVPWPIGPVPEINVPDMDPDHHRKFRRNRARHLGLVRPATDRLLQTTTTPRQIPLTGPAPLLPPLPGPPLLTPGGRVRPIMGGRIPPKPPLLAQGDQVRPIMGGRIPPKPPLSTPLVRYALEWGGGSPPNPPSLRPWSGTPYNGGETPPNPPKHCSFANGHFRYLSPLAALGD